MNARRLGAIARGFASLVVALALLVGVPIGLARFVGWPLPESMPDADTFSSALRTGINDEFVVKTLAVLAWLAWFQLLLAVVAETIGLLRGRQPLRLPVVPAFQGFAGRLVAGILLLVTPLQPMRAVAQPAPVPPAMAEAPAAMAFIPGRQASQIANAPSAMAPPDRSAPAPEYRTVTVQRHDSYWAIAEHELGDGLRWREIRDLNVGSTMTGGYRIVAGDETLRAGWTLQLPADVTEPALPFPAEEVTVEPGDNLWDLSEVRLAEDLERPPSDDEVVPYWNTVIDVNRPRLVDPANPSLIYPGQVLRLPPTGLVAPASRTEEPAITAPPPPAAPTEPSTEPPAPSAATTPTSTTVARTSPTDPAVTEAPTDPPEEGVAQPEESGSDDPIPWMIVGGLSSAALAVGMKRLLNRRRRSARLNGAGARPQSAETDEERELHHAVVALADEDAIDDLQAVLGQLACHLAGDGQSCRPRIVQQSPDRIEILLDTPSATAPPGWEIGADGNVLTIDVPITVLDADGPICPAPLLVTIGQPEDEAQLYLDLEAEAVVGLVGDRDSGRKLARSILTELALAPLADTLRVIVVGDLVAAEAAGLDHLSLADSWQEVDDDLTSWIEQSHQVLAEHEWPNTFVARGHDPDDDALIPIVVIAAEPPPTALLTTLNRILPAAAAVVVVGDFEGVRTRVRCDPHSFEIEDVGLEGTPQAVGTEELEAMGRLLVASGEDHAPHVLDLRDDGDPSVNGDAPPLDTPLDPDADSSAPPYYEILVRLLGDIRVDGGKPLNPKPTAVVAYLAVHREVTPERLEEACWFGSDGTSHRRRLRDVMTECRDALGSQHLPANRGGLYRAGDLVGTDLDLFDWYVDRASHQPGGEAVESYRTALGLVTGKLFSYPNMARASYGWVDFEHHATTWEPRVAGVAQACAELLLDIAEPAEAVDLLRRLLHALPLNGALVESLMRAHLAASDRTSADRVYQAHRKALEQAKLGDPDDAIEQLCLELRATK